MEEASLRSHGGGIMEEVSQRRQGFMEEASLTMPQKGSIAQEGSWRKPHTGDIME
jgi:hypothetical protein